MFNLFNLNPEAFGLDISDSSLRIIKLKKKRNILGLASFGEIEIKPGIVKNGEIKNQQALTEAIKESFKKVKGQKLRTRYVVASLPEEEAFIQIIQMPKMNKEELKSAILFEIENYIPLSIEETYFDFQVVEPVYDHLDHLDVLIVAIPKKVIDPYISSLKGAGLIPKALETESQAISRALVKNEVTSFPLLLLYFGTSKVNFTMFSGYSLRFTTSISISSKKLDEAVSRSLKVDIKQARRLRFKYGLRPESTGKGKKIFEALIPSLTDLIEQIKKYINYYHSHAAHEHLPPDGKKVEKILVCGEEANLSGLTDFLSKELKVLVEIGNPWVNILPNPLNETPELPFKESLKYTIALGLALRGIKNNK